MSTSKPDPQDQNIRFNAFNALVLKFKNQEISDSSRESKARSIQNENSAPSIEDEKFIAIKLQTAELLLGKSEHIIPPFIEIARFKSGWHISLYRKIDQNNSIKYHIGIYNPKTNQYDSETEVASSTISKAIESGISLLACALAENLETLKDAAVLALDKAEQDEFKIQIQAIEEHDLLTAFISDAKEKAAKRL